MATISFIEEWTYTGTSGTQTMPVNSNQPYSFIGKDNASSPAIYYTYVAKLYTSAAIMNPTLYIYCAGTDRTSDRKWLAAKYVPCSSDSTPSNTYLGQAIDGDTRLRFDRKWDGSSWTTVSGYAQGDSTNVIIPQGYFFVYIAHNTTSIDQHSMSTMRAWSATVNPPRITATDAPTYTISYDANGGSGTTSSQTVVQGETTQLRSNNFTAPSNRLYTVTLNGNGGNNGTPTYGSPVNKFNQWLKDSTSGTGYSAGADFEPTADTTFYAQWYTPTILGTTTRSNGSASGYTVSFNANGGSCDIDSLTAQDRVEYSFVKWNSKKDGTGTNYSSSTATYKITSTRTLYAQWESDQKEGTGEISLPTAKNVSTSTLTITFDYQGGAGTITSGSSTKTITKAFNGWSTSATATSGSTGTYTPTSTHTLYAVWGSETIKYDAISLPTPTRTGYTFMGWADSASASSGETGAYTPTHDITTLYAIWEANGNIRIYVNNTDKYKMAMVYVYAPTSTSDTKPWKLAIPYLKDSSSWKIVAG